MITQKGEKGNAKASTPSDNRVQALLMEYELSYTNANHLEEVIWKTAAILVTGSITGLDHKRVDNIAVEKLVKIVENKQSPTGINPPIFITIQPELIIRQRTS